MSPSRDAEYTEYVAARLPSLRRLAAVLCDDRQRADDLVQATLTQLYVRWGLVREASHPDAYARAVLVREFIHERRSVWVRRVSLRGRVTDLPAAMVDHDAVLDPAARRRRCLLPGQRATLVLRFYCDLNVDQSAAVLGCSTGTVKSQTARGLEAVRRSPPVYGTPPIPAGRAPRQNTSSPPEALVMIESQLRALFTEIADGESATSRVDTQLAHRWGRARLRWRRSPARPPPRYWRRPWSRVVAPARRRPRPGLHPAQLPGYPRRASSIRRFRTCRSAGCPWETSWWMVR